MTRPVPRSTGHRATVRVRFEADEPTAVLAVEVHAAPGSGPDPTAALAAVVDHVFRWHDCVRVVTFVAATDERSQRCWEGAGLRAVAVDGDELVYYRARRPAVADDTGLSPAGP